LPSLFFNDIIIKSKQSQPENIVKFTITSAMTHVYHSFVSTEQNLAEMRKLQALGFIFEKNKRGDYVLQYDKETGDHQSIEKEFTTLEELVEFSKVGGVNGIIVTGNEILIYNNYIE